jgi:hypothetical protein
MNGTAKAFSLTWNSTHSFIDFDYAADRYMVKIAAGWSPSICGDITGPENPIGSGQYPPDGKVDMRDISLACYNFNQYTPSVVPPEE